MPFGLLLDLWECHKQYTGAAKPKREYFIDDIIPDGIRHSNLILATQMSQLYYELSAALLIIREIRGILYKKVATQLSQVRGDYND